MIDLLLWFKRSSDRSHMADALIYFSFQPVLHNRCNWLWYVLSCLHNGAHKRSLAANQFTQYQPTDSLHGINLLTEYTISTYSQFTRYQFYYVNLLTVYTINLLTVYRVSTYWQFTLYQPTDSLHYQPTDSLHSINLLTVYTVSTYWQFTQYQPTDSLHGINLLTVYTVSTYWQFTRY